MKRKYLFVVGSIAIISAVIVLALIQVNSVHSGPQDSTPTPTYVLNPNAPIILPEMPTAVIPKITDLAPNIPYEDKPSVVVQHADGSTDQRLRGSPRGRSRSRSVRSTASCGLHRHYAHM